MKPSLFLKGSSPLIQLFVLLLLSVVGNLLCSAIALAFYSLQGDKVNLFDQPDTIRLLQFSAAIGTFLLPSLLWARLCCDSVKEALSIKKISRLQIVWWSLAGLVAIGPVIALTEWLNRQILLPHFLAPLEQWMRMKEDSIQQITNSLLTETGIFAFLLNLIVIAATAAVTEEFLFRGALQRILSKWIPNHHALIWVVALLFSLFHLQFYGLIPRMIIGAYLGYLLYWSKSIWLPVVVHLANNALVVIGTGNERWQKSEWITGEISQPTLPLLLVVAVTGLALCLFITRKIRANC